MSIATSGRRLGAAQPSLVPAVILVGLVVSQAMAADETPPHAWIGTEVVVKDLFVQPRIGLEVAHPTVRGHRLHVAGAQGSWLWVTSGDTRGWVHQQEVVPLTAAISYFSAVLQSHPTSAQAYYLRGLVWAEQNEPNLAIADFTAAIKRDAKNAWAFHQRGNAYGELREYQKAIADYDEAIRLNARDAAAYNNRGLAQDRAGKYDQAIADYNEAIRQDPHLLNAYYNRAGALAEKGEDARAVVEYDYVVRHAPNDADAHARLAWLLATSDVSGVPDPAQALKEATIATELSGGKEPSHVEALAAAHAAFGQWDKAVEVQSKAVGLLPKGSAERTRAEARLKRYSDKQPVRE